MLYQLQLITFYQESFFFLSNVLFSVFFLHNSFQFYMAYADVNLEDN